MRLQIDIEPLEPIILTRFSATVGAHECLRFFPGACVLGAAVTALGYDPDDPDTWDLFHADTVRFGDALPLLGQEIAVACPLSWHKLKQGDQLYDLSHSRPEGQVEQEREGFVTQSGVRVEPSVEFALRTAIAHDGGRAEEGFLHGAQQLAVGQQFRGFISADRPELLDQLARVFDGAVHHFGRARTAEVGSARTTVARAGYPNQTSRKVAELRVLCASDVALRDGETGTPRLRPLPSDLGLPAGWSLDGERTFIRVRRYSPFNGHRRRPDPERQAIVAGSVWTFTGPTMIDAADIAARVRSGIGEHRRDGLGMVLVDPPQLASPTPRTTVRLADPPSIHDIPSDELGGWLKARVQAAEAVARVSHEAVRAFKNRGIGSSQWGEIRRLSRLARTSRQDHGSFTAELRRHLEHGARRLDKNWRTVVEGRTGAEALLEWAEEHDAASVESLACRVVRPGGEP